MLINTCLVTNDVKGLAAFYARVLQIEPQWSGDSYVEFRTGAGVLALFSAEAQDKYIPGAARPAQNHSAILEFRVSDVDREYARLGNTVRWVKGPTTQPWGTRSIYFRDPDGNLIDFFTAARKR
ncbi:MAG TPA: VOC family protein [Terracidiphilus sp.]|nr:VOC family protein [Terracidiphilus sp.]